MSRSRRFGSLHAGNGERASIGDVHVDNACGTINRLCATTVGLMTKYPHSREETLRMLFSDNVLDRMAAVNGLVDASTDIKQYPIDGANLWINYTDAKVPAIEATALHAQQERIGPLLQFIKDVKAIHFQFEEVKQTLRWLNRNATPGAIRFYWPTALKLCPASPAFTDLADVPTRHSNPPGIGERMQMLKDAASCVVSALMLPADAKPTDKRDLWLSIPATDAGDTLMRTHYGTDTMTYNI